MPLNPTDLLNNRYRIERVLGHGGMGAVYLATDESLGIACAVKENLSVSPESERQFKREATLLAGLRHQNLPRVTNHFILGNQQYLVMDFVEGEDLKERLAREGRLPADDVLRWALQILDALAYLHGRQPPVVHRDIKPANIKLTKSGVATLVDFGIAKATESGQKTTTGAAAFTPGFAPPEQYGMGRTDGRTDLYALGATLYTLLTGQTPPDSLERLMSGAHLVPPAELLPGLAPHVSRALVRALEVKPENRFQTAAEFKAALENEGDKTEPAAQPRASEREPAAAETVVRRPTPRPGWLIPAAAGGLVLVVLAVVFGWPLIGGAAGRATATRAPAATGTQSAPSAVAARSTDTPAPATMTSTEAPLPTETATPEPPTATPTVVGTPLGAGPRIAFISNRDGKFYQIYTMNPDGSDVQQLTFDERNKWDPNWPFRGTQLAWSPDGQRLVYVADGGGENGLDLWMMSADGTNQQDITLQTADDFQPVWCDNQTLAYTSNRARGIEQVMMLTLGERPRNISATHSSPREYDPVCLPGSSGVLFVTTVNGPVEFRRWLFDGSSYGRVRTREPDSVDEPALSPDGTLLAYIVRTSSSNEIFVGALADRFTDQQLTTTLGNSGPQWSPDSRWLVFVSTRDGNREIYTMTAGGAAQTNLTHNPALDTDPVWQP